MKLDIRKALVEIRATQNHLFCDTHVPRLSWHRRTGPYLLIAGVIIHKFLWVFAQTSVVLGDGFLIFRRNSVGLPGTCLAQRTIATQQKFQPVDGAEQVTLHPLDHRRIARETARIEVLHLPRQLRHLFRGLRIVLNQLLEPV